MVAIAPVSVREKVPDLTLMSKVSASSSLILMAPELTNLTISIPASSLSKRLTVSLELSIPPNPPEERGKCVKVYLCV
ncbi:MAG: hypothetical protein MK111_20305 [Crocosphaera sp.]|uniref:hypothetical protein n=1 Tax=Crocosphaera sp. TaxID=2729996 RepID=UPI00258CCF68|nr:hypothetical protein [Crocosphaera sp.]MCH2246940.1 hypothetical protein [Crocosphaera sp.]